MPSTRFKDFSLNFKDVSFTGDISTVSDEKAISQSIRNIILTNEYERLFNPDFSGEISNLLFENWTDVTKSLIETRITNAIQNYEPRANLISVSVVGDPDSNTAKANIVYRAKTSIQNISVSIILERIF